MPVITTLHSQQCFCVFFLCSSWQGTQNIFQENKIKKTRRIFHSYFAVVASVVGSTDHFSAVAAEPSLAEFGYLAVEKNLARCGSSKKEPNNTLPIYHVPLLCNRGLQKIKQLLGTSGFFSMGTFQPTVPLAQPVKPPWRLISFVLTPHLSDTFL